jgi:hypothetical protein
MKVGTNAKYPPEPNHARVSKPFCDVKPESKLATAKQSWGSLEFSVRSLVLRTLGSHLLGSAAKSHSQQNNDKNQAPKAHFVEAREQKQ